jgi:hypothetical protein
MPRSAPIGNKNARNRRSQRAKGAALAVLENVGKKGKKSLYRILIDEGYSHWTAKNPQQVFGTKSAQEILHPMLEAAEEARALAIAAILENKKFMHKLPITDLALLSNRMTNDIDSMGGNKPNDENKNERLREYATIIGGVLKEFGMSA